MERDTREKKNISWKKKKNKGLSYGKILTKKIKVRGGSCWSQGVKDPPCYCNFGYIYIYNIILINVITIYDFIYVSMDRS